MGLLRDTYDNLLSNGSESRVERVADPSEQTEALDSMFDALSNERRRLALAFVAQNAPTDIGEIADHLARIEEGAADGERISSDARKRVYVALYQVHLSKLADLGIIDADDGYREVTPGERMDGALALIDHAIDISDEKRGR